jgi:hypothetical protein
LTRIASRAIDEAVRESHGISALDLTDIDHLHSQSLSGDSQH